MDVGKQKLIGRRSNDNVANVEGHNVYSLDECVTTWAVVVAQFVEQLLPTPKICSSNPVQSLGNLINNQM